MKSTGYSILVFPGYYHLENSTELFKPIWDFYGRGLVKLISPIDYNLSLRKFLETGKDIPSAKESFQIFSEDIKELDSIHTIVIPEDWNSGNRNGKYGYLDIIKFLRYILKYSKKEIIMFKGGVPVVIKSLPVIDDIYETIFGEKEVMGNDKNTDDLCNISFNIKDIPSEDVVRVMGILTKRRNKKFPEYEISFDLRESLNLDMKKRYEYKNPPFK